MMQQNNEKLLTQIQQLDERNAYLSRKYNFVINLDIESFKKYYKGNEVIDNDININDDIYNTVIAKGAKIVKKLDSGISNEEIDNEFHDWKDQIGYDLKLSIDKNNRKIKHIKDRINWNNLSENDKKDFKVDITFYKANVSGYWLVLSTVLISLLSLISLLDVMEKSFWVAIVVLLNIAFLLFLFTAAIKVKNYKNVLNVPLIVFGVYILLRLFVLYPYLVKIDYSLLSGGGKFLIYAGSIYIAVVSIYVGVTSQIKIDRQLKFIEAGKITQKHLSK